MHTPVGLSFDYSLGALATFPIINGLAHLIRAVYVGAYCVLGPAPSTSIDKPLNPHRNSENS